MHTAEEDYYVNSSVKSFETVSPTDPPVNLKHAKNLFNFLFALHVFSGNLV